MAAQPAQIPRSEKPRRARTRRPKRSYRAVIESLRQVWKIEPVAAADAIWQFGKAEFTALPSRPLRLTVWNLCKGAGSLLFEHDYRFLLYRSDLVLTQEALLSERGLQTFGEPGFHVTHAASYRRRDGLRDGVMTVARAVCAGEQQRIICKYPEPIFGTPKAALINFFRLDGNSEPLMVINVHATLVRTQSGAAEEMRHLLSFLPEHRGPILLAGDFNTFTAKYLETVSREAHRLGLRHVPIEDDPRSRLTALDQVYIRGLEVVRAYVDTTVKSSDHFPLVLDLVPK